MLTDQWIEEQLQICEAATEGPWMLGWPEQQWPMARRSVTSIATKKDIILSGVDQHGYNPTGIQHEEDGVFIVNAREGYAKALERLRVLQDVIDNVAAFAEVRQFQSYCEMIFSALAKFRTDNFILI